MKVHRGYKFRIYPTEEQQGFLAHSFGCSRYVWNYFLNERKNHFITKVKGKGLSYYDQCADLTNLKKSDETKWLSEVNSQSLQQTLRALDVAYNRFFRKVSKLPKFKSKRDDQSFCVPQRFCLEGKSLWIPKLKKPLKIVAHRQFGKNAKILFVVISKTKTGKYFASFCAEEDRHKANVLTKETGIDLGLTDLMTFSDGTKVVNPKIAWKQRKKLSYLQRQHSKKKKAEANLEKKTIAKGTANQGKNREKARLRLAKCHEKIVNVKNDFHHKLTHRITEENQLIVMEDLGVIEMMQNRRLARGIGEVSWAEIVRQLKYKSEWKGRTFVQIDRYFPSSKLCSCGFIYQGLTLKDRSWTCPKCSLTNDRDVNAARNILQQGKIALNSGEGLPSESTGKPAKKQKLKEALLKDTRKEKNKRVYELRGPGIYSGE